MDGTKKITRAEGTKRRAKKAAVRSLNVIHAMDYGKSAPAPPAPASAPVPAAPGGPLVPAPVAGAVKAPPVAAGGSDRSRIKVSKGIGLKK